MKNIALLKCHQRVVSTYSLNFLIFPDTLQSESCSFPPHHCAEILLSIVLALVVLQHLSAFTFNCPVTWSSPVLSTLSRFSNASVSMDFLNSILRFHLLFQTFHPEVVFLAKVSTVTHTKTTPDWPSQTLPLSSRPNFINGCQTLCTSKFKSNSLSPHTSFYSKMLPLSKFFSHFIALTCNQTQNLEILLLLFHFQWVNKSYQLAFENLQNTSLSLIILQPISRSSVTLAPINFLICSINSLYYFLSPWFSFH